MSKLLTKGKGGYPTKRSINLMGVGEKPLNLKVAIPSVILILVLAVIISKFAVVDRMVAVSRAEQKLANTKSTLDAGYAAIAGYGELTDKYAHYTYSDMTQEELTRPNRVAVMDMLRRIILPNLILDSWSVSERTLNITVTGETLEKINRIAQQLREDSMVNFCSVNTAIQYSDIDGRVIRDDLGLVTAKITVYLSAQEEVARQ